MYAYCINNPINYYDNAGNIPKKATYRIDDKGKNSEHIHVEYNGNKYSWYLNPSNKDSRHNNDLGYSDLSKTLKKQLLKDGIPARYINLNKKSQSNFIVLITSITIIPISVDSNAIDVTPIAKPTTLIETYPLQIYSRYSVENYPAFPISNSINIESKPIQSADSGLIVMILISIIGIIGMFSGGVPAGISY